MIKTIVIWFSSTKLGNALHMLVSKYRSRNIVPTSPKYVHIETTSLCNAKCVMCAHSTMKRAKKTMSDELYEKIVVEVVKNGIKRVNLQFYGEPLLDKKIFERIKRLKKEGLEVKLNTNASLLNDENAQKLISSGIDKVNISFDAFNREKYNKIRIGLDYDKVIANIENFLEMTKKTSSPKPRTMMTFVCLEQNKDEAEAFEKKWKGKADETMVSYARSWAGQMDVKSGRKKSFLAVDKNICKAMWNDLIILQDGTVALCCDDYEGMSNMGNLNHQKLADIWTGEKFIRYRKFHRDGKRRELGPCKNCNSYSYWWLK